MNLFKAYNDLTAVFELAAKEGLEFFFGQNLTEEFERLDEEEQKMFGRQEKAAQRLLRQFEKIDDKETIILCIVNESPTLMARAVERAKELDLTLADLYYILNVDGLEFEDRQFFAKMWVEQSNLAEGLVWIVVLAKKNPLKAGIELFDLSRAELNKLNLRALAMIKSPVQATAKKLYVKYFGALA